MTPQHLDVPRNLRRGGRQADTEAALASAVELLAKQLVEDTSWTVESLHDPQEYIRHFMVCAPDPGERG